MACRSRSTVLQFNSFSNIFYTFQEYQPSRIGQVPIHSSNFAPENAVNWDAQGCGFAIHRPAAADHQVGMPQEVKTVDHSVEES